MTTIGDSRTPPPARYGLAVLAELASAETSLGEADLARLTGASRPTVQRSLVRLSQFGYLTVEPKGRYRLVDKPGAVRAPRRGDQGEISKRAPM